MKKILLLLAFVYNTSYGQGLGSGGAVTPMAGPTNPPTALLKRVTFTYDTAGNQIRRKVILLTAARHGNNLDDNSEKDYSKAVLLPSDEYAGISYYPNPVRSELYIEWKEFANEDLLSFELYDQNGRLLKKIGGQGQNNSLVLNFESFPAGMYHLLLVYNDGTNKTLQIVKR